MPASGRCRQCHCSAPDTIVVFNGTIFGKPADAADAKRMLKLLSGTRHEVLTCGGDRRQTDAATPACRGYAFATWSNEIDAYIASGEPMGKAGAYAIQGLGGIFVERLEGSYSGVMGFRCLKLRCYSRASASGL